MKVKYVDEKDYVTDELYTDFYICPYCDHRTIITEANFCSNCGHRVYWKRKPKKRNTLDFTQFSNLCATPCDQHLVLAIKRSAATRSKKSKL